jgi:hypothetical protein
MLKNIQHLTHTLVKIQYYVIVYIKFYIDLKALYNSYVSHKILNNDKIIIHNVQVLMK